MTERDQQSVPVCWVGKEDMLSCRPDLTERVADLDADDLARIADKLGDALQDSYWMALEIILTDYFGSENDDDEPGEGAI